MFNFILLSLLTSLQIFVIIPLVILHFFKIQAYQISDQSEINELITKLSIKRATFIKESKPYGFVYGKWYIGYISKNENEKEGGQTMYLVIRSNDYEKINKEITSEIDKEGKVVEQKFITFWDRTGNPWWWNYRERKYNTTKYMPYEPRDYQQNIIDNIKETIKGRSSKSGTFFCYGEPGVGKSAMLMLLVKQLEGFYCDTWNPTDAGDYLNKAYRSINPTDEKPLVMVLEECDGILMDILENRIKPHKEIPIQIRKKMDWNKMLDKINYGLYPNLILILTSNIHLEDINVKDGSLLRENRIHGAFHMTRKMLNDSIKSKFE